MDDILLIDQYLFSKMTPILYNDSTEYTTKWKRSAEWYDVAINSTMKTCSQTLLVKF